MGGCLHHVSVMMCVRTPPLFLCVLGKVLKQCFENICQLLVENESRLNDLDKASGDGDTGTTLRIGGTGKPCL